MKRPCSWCSADCRGTGKSTLAKRRAAERSAAYVRVDEIETVLAQKTALGSHIGAAGYLVAFAIARSNLSCGNTVVADSVNPVPQSREGWQNVACAAGVALLEIELVCSDEDEHRRRVEERETDVPGLAHPNREMVRARTYSAWTTDRLVIDTARLTPDEALAEIARRLDATARERAPEPPQRI